MKAIKEREKFQLEIINLEHKAKMTYTIIIGIVVVLLAVLVYIQSPLF